MLSFFLMRHADATRAISPLADFDRPLSGLGRRNAREVGQALIDAQVPIARICVSPALRTLTTARIHADALELPANAVVADERIYDATLNTLTLVLAEQTGSEALALCGHNPGCTELAHWLAACPFGELPTGAALEFALDIGRWSDLSEGCGRLLRYWFPNEQRSAE
jgi:phosphohistidine phosphatase